MAEYNQPIKCKARHDAIANAIKIVTLDRTKSSVVGREYVRDLYDYIYNKDEISKDKLEINCIEKQYITAWEKLHDSCEGTRRVEDLKVCYLCGPEPNNDFKEFIEYGILPNNIWAFENDSKHYSEAICKFKDGEYPQPRIIRQNVESYFRYSDQKFDIIYLDFCCSFVSEKHGLRCIKTLFEKGRLNSNGVLITNYSVPDLSKDQRELAELISIYMYFKNEKPKEFKIVGERIELEELNKMINRVNENLAYYYGEFISLVIRDVASIIVPVQKLANNDYFSKLFSKCNNLETYSDLFRASSHNPIAQFAFTTQYIFSNNYKNKALKRFLNELGGMEALCNSFGLMIKMQNAEIKDDPVLKENIEYFESGSIYQFLDKVHKNMFWDIIINQLTYPMHYNNRANYRYEYIAKKNTMLMDVTCFDECRYIYEWLPAIHQIKSAFQNKSWQYVFRFALDGLVKSRIQHNKELFYQGSVINEEQEEFSRVTMIERIKIS